MATPNGLNPQFEAPIRTGSLVAASAVAGSTVAVMNFSTTAGLGLYVGTGAPTITAAKGSLYINVTGSSTSTRVYVNTNAGTTWASLTTSA